MRYLAIFLILVFTYSTSSAKMKIWYGLPSVAQFLPVIDKSRVDNSKFETDLSDCRNIAIPIEKDLLLLLKNRNDLKLNNGAVYGSMMLGGTAGYMAARYGSSRQQLGSTLAGAIAAGAGAAAIQNSNLKRGLSFAAVTEPKRIVENCLIGRGYNILNTPNYNGMIKWEAELDLSKCENNGGNFDLDCM